MHIKQKMHKQYKKSKDQNNLVQNSQSNKQIDKMAHL